MTQKLYRTLNILDEFSRECLADPGQTQAQLD